VHVVHLAIARRYRHRGIAESVLSELADEAAPRPVIR
jgi:ribosomal protein S18 acetylase RimI-like enzyme